MLLKSIQFHWIIIISEWIWRDLFFSLLIWCQLDQLSISPYSSLIGYREMESYRIRAINKSVFSRRVRSLHENRSERFVVRVFVDGIPNGISPAIITKWCGVGEKHTLVLLGIRDAFLHPLKPQPPLSQFQSWSDRSRRGTITGSFRFYQPP